MENVSAVAARAERNKLFQMESLWSCLRGIGIKESSHIQQFGAKTNSVSCLRVCNALLQSFPSTLTGISDCSSFAVFSLALQTPLEALPGIHILLSLVALAQCRYYSRPLVFVMVRGIKEHCHWLVHIAGEEQPQ